MNLNVALRAVLISGVATLGLATHAAAQVTGVEFVGEVEDSLSYLVYWYELTNPSASAWAIAALQLDISASSGTPTNLPASGDIVIVPGFGSEQPHAEVGPIAPTGWRSIQSPLARLRWAPPNTRSFSGDSVAPGASKGGFGLRSTYLPGINSIEAFPTIESCCREPTDTTGGEFIYAMPSQLAVTGSTIAPRYMPEEVTIDLLQTQLTAVCTDPLWLDDSQLCAEFADLQDLAEDEEGDGNFYGAAAVLGRMKDRVSEAQASMEANAFWLLSLNAAQAESNALDSAATVADQWHVLNTSHGPLSGGWDLSDTTQSQGAISGTMPASTHQPFDFLKQVGSSAAFADGSWSVQLDFFGMTANDAGLLLRDITVRRYNSSGSLLESQALAAGTVTTLPSGATRISLTNAVTGWSSGSATDFLGLQFYLENDGASAEDYSIRAGVDEGDWGGSWLSQPK